MTVAMTAKAMTRKATTRKDALYIIDNLNARDKHEVTATLVGTFSPQIIADSILDRTDAESYCEFYDETPCLMYGYYRTLPHIAVLWSLGTNDKFKRLRNLIDAFTTMSITCREHGIKRFQSSCLYNPEERQIMPALGLKLEGLMPGIGKDGETFALWGIYYGKL